MGYILYTSPLYIGYVLLVPFIELFLFIKKIDIPWFIIRSLHMQKYVLFVENYK